MAPRKRVTTTNRPTITDFLAWSFSSNAKQRMRATRIAANMAVMPGGTDLLANTAAVVVIPNVVAKLRVPSASIYSIRMGVRRNSTASG